MMYKIALELVKDGKVFGYVMYSDVVRKLAYGEYYRVKYAKPMPMMSSHDCQQLVEVDSVEVTVRDLLVKKYREIDISKERLNELKHIHSIICKSITTDFDSADKIYIQIKEIEKIRYELDIHS